MIVQALRAVYGDALVVKSSNVDNPFTIVIDGGPEETADAISDYYLSLGYIDLLILTHYDEDHIKGLLCFFAKLDGTDKRIGTLWTNCARCIDFDIDDNTAAYGDAYSLATYLSKLHEIGVIGEWRDDISAGIHESFNELFQVNVLSPSYDVLQKLKTKYEQYIKDNGLEDDPDVEEDVSYGTVLANISKTMDELVKSFKKTSTTFMNTTSIAILLQAEGRTILLMGDAEPNVIVESLAALGASKKAPIHVDIMKVSHHGSKSNISKDLLSVIDCDKFLFTTNGGTGGAYHPDRTTLACLKEWTHTMNDRRITLFFNYPLRTIMERNTGLLSDEERNLFIVVDNFDNPLIPSIEI